MRILVTGAKGFVGRNLCSVLHNIKNKKEKKYADLIIDEIYEFDIDSDTSILDEYCEKCDFIFNLAGVNRSIKAEDFINGNFGFTSVLLNTLKKYKNYCPIMNSSSIQAVLENDYGKSKKAGEELLFEYSKTTGAEVFIYRFPNLFGKWCLPNYNSVLATFCNNIANDLPITVNNKDTVLTLVYIDDLIKEMINLIVGKGYKVGDYYEVRERYEVTLGNIVELLYSYKSQSDTLLVPNLPNESFEKKLYSTYLSYLPTNRFAYNLKMNIDSRGSFTEIFKTINNGQFSVNISKPGIKKGEHWHLSKCEIFVVVSGHGLIQERKIGTEEIINHEVSGKEIKAVYMIPGYTHNIINLSDKDDLITLMWSNEIFDGDNPDTYYESVDKNEDY